MLWTTPRAQDEAFKALTYIRTAVDKVHRYSTFSALSGFWACIAALIGSGVCGIFPDWPGASPAQGPKFLQVWITVWFVATMGQFGFTFLKARSRGESFFSPIAVTALTVLAGPFLAGGLGTVAFWKAGQFALMPGLWLTLYGCGLYAVSYFAPIFLRVFGLVFMALGFAAWMTGPEMAALWLGLGFGGLHAVFGAMVLARYRK